MWTFSGRIDGSLLSVVLRPHIVHPAGVAQRKSKKQRSRLLSSSDVPTVEMSHGPESWAFSGKALLATPIGFARAYDPEDVLLSLERLYDENIELTVLRERVALVQRPGVNNQVPLGGARARWQISTWSVDYGNILTLDTFRHRNADGTPIGGVETRPMTADWKLTIVRLK